MPDPRPVVEESPLLGVMGAARVLGIATATLRSWDRRYGLTPSTHTKGGHRRYNAQDMARLQAMGRMVRAGVPPAEAARACLDLPVDALLSADEPIGHRIGQGANASEAQSQGPPVVEALGAHRSLGVLAQASGPANPPAPARSRPATRLMPVEQHQTRPASPSQNYAGDPAGSPERGLARAAAALDRAACVATLRSSLACRGAVATWDDVVRPLLARIGTRWANTGAGVEVEHVLSAAVTFTFEEYASGLPMAVNGAASVLLASAPDEMHDIPMTVLTAALAEHGIHALHLGARTPGRALGDALARVRPAVLVLWAQDCALARIPALPAMRPAPALLLCGPGWPERASSQVARDLTGALNRIGSLLGIGPLTHLAKPLLLAPYDQVGESR